MVRWREYTPADPRCNSPEQAPLADEATNRRSKSHVDPLPLLQFVELRFGLLEQPEPRPRALWRRRALRVLRQQRLWDWMRPLADEAAPAWERLQVPLVRLERAWSRLRARSVEDPRALGSADGSPKPKVQGLGMPRGSTAGDPSDRDASSPRRGAFRDAPCGDQRRGPRVAQGVVVPQRNTEMPGDGREVVSTEPGKRPS